MDTARYARQSDRELNPSFRRRWRDDFQPRPAPTDEGDAGEGVDAALAVVIRWRDEWRARERTGGSGSE